MKTRASFLIAAALAAGGLSAHAAAPAKGPKTGDYKGLKHDKIPDNVYGVFSYEDAQKEAVKKKKPMAYLVTDERADDPAVKAAGTKAFWAIEDDALVVVLRASTAGEWKRLPAKVGDALKSPDLGKEYPKLLATNEDASLLLAGMTSSTVVGLDAKAFDKFGKELKKLNAAKTPSTDYPPPNPAAPAVPATTPPGTTVKPAEKPGAPSGTPAAPVPPAPAPAPPPAPVLIKNPQVEKWTNTDGVTIQATLIEVKADSVTFEMSYGGKVNYDIAKLSDASKKRVEELKAASK